jgi:NAD(P)-dependent dehydrogenase (short-subunit alcohol dehydrogenase family)
LSTPLPDLPLFSLAERVAVVTGGLGLLGREHCRALAGSGATVVVADLDERDAAAFARDLSEECSRPTLGGEVDVADPGSVSRLRDRVLERFGRLDVLVNNAGLNDRVEDLIPSRGRPRFEDYPLESWKRLLEVNATGTFLCSQILGSEMARRGSGSIVNIASTYALVAPNPALYRRPDATQTFWKSPAYPASKGAVLAFTRFLAAYWGSAGVRVNALSPGGVENGQEGFFIRNYSSRTPLGRMARPCDYRGALVFLASDASSYMTGANLVVDGGWTTW